MKWMITVPMGLVAAAAAIALLCGPWVIAGYFWATHGYWWLLFPAYAIWRFFQYCIDEAKDK